MLNIPLRLSHLYHNACIFCGSSCLSLFLLAISFWRLTSSASSICRCADSRSGLEGRRVNCCGFPTGREAWIVFIRVGMNSWSCKK